MIKIATSDFANTPLPSKSRLMRWPHFGRLLSGYFVSRHWPIAWALLALVLLMEFGGVQSLFLMLDWQKELFDAIGSRNSGAIVGIALHFVLIAAGITATGVLGVYITGLLEIRWRNWLTDRYSGRWVEGSIAYEIERDGIVDNPDQRIAEDLMLFVQQVLQLMSGFFRATYGVFLYSAVLYAQSRTTQVSLGGMSVTVPADFLTYTLGWAAFSYVVMYFVGKPLIRRTMRMQKAEADFRYKLTNVRRAAEQIAFYRAARAEWERLRERFRRIRHAFNQLLVANMGVQFTGNVLGQMNDLIPVVAALPRYFAGSMSLGDIMQTRAAFQALQGSLSWFVQAYPMIATTIAIVNRIHLLDEAMERPEATGIVTRADPAVPLAANDVTVVLPTGEPLVALGDWQVREGERWAIRGSSGAGKSTLLRAFAGLWRNGSGTIARQTEAVMFVPQRLYLSDGNLREIMAFPRAIEEIDDAPLAESLAAVGLARLGTRLDEYRGWDRELSPGEQQRLGFARILFHRPRVLFLDEATSALDADNARRMYEMLREAIPDLTLVSVIHSEALAPFHDHVLTVADGSARVAA